MSFCCEHGHELLSFAGEEVLAQLKGYEIFENQLSSWKY
jgi:hypothetical protein